MQSVLKSLVILCHFSLFGILLYHLFQEADVVREKLFVSILIFITLNLLRLLQKENSTNSNDQF